MCEKNEEALRFIAVFRDEKFVEMFDPVKEYGGEYSFRKLESWPGGFFWLVPGWFIGNVDGTTFDPNHNLGASWIDIFRNNVAPPFYIPLDCPLCGYPYNARGGIVGAHMTNIPNPNPPNPPVPLPVPNGPLVGTANVFIVPTCRGCNASINSWWRIAPGPQIAVLGLTHFMQGTRFPD
jgi:hypothetical protein